MPDTARPDAVPESRRLAVPADPITQIRPRKRRFSARADAPGHACEEHSETSRLYAADCRGGWPVPIGGMAAAG